MWFRTRFPSRLPARKASRPSLVLVALEDRTLPSNIVWVNRLTATDTFTPTERADVDQAIAVWSNLIVNLNTASNTLDLTILGGSNSGLNLGAGTLALTDEVNVDNASHPENAARIRIDADGARLRLVR